MTIITHIVKFARREYVILGAILAVAGGLRFANLNVRETHFDALKQIVVADLPLNDLLAGVSSHLSLPLDYLVTSGLLRVGIDELTFLRFPAAIYGVISVVLIWRLAKLVTSDSVIGLVSAFLLAVSHMSVDWSQRVRLYSLFLMLALLVLIAFVKFKETGSIRWLIAWIGTSVLAVYTHYFAFLLVMSLTVYLLLSTWFKYRLPEERQKRNRLMTLGSLGAMTIGIFFLPWLPTTIDQLGGQSGTLTYGYTDPVRVVWGTIHNYSSRLPLREGGIFIDLLYGVGALASVWQLLRCKRETLFMLTFVAAMPLVILAAYTAIIGPVTTPRNQIFLLPMWLIVVSSGARWIGATTFDRIQRMPSPVRIVSVAVSVLVLAALPVIALAPVYQYFKVESQAVNLLAVADISNTRAEQSDIVFTVDIPPENLKVVYKGSLNIAPLSSSIEDVETLLASSTQRDEQCIWLVTKNANIGSKTASKVLPYWADPVTRHAKLQLKIGASVGSASSSQSPSGLYLSCADSRPRL